MHEPKADDGGAVSPSLTSQSDDRTQAQTPTPDGHGSIDAGMVSVVIPTTGRAAVADAVSSVLSQTYRQLEVVVVYDGPDDGLLVELPSDPRLKVIATGKRGGPGPARTLGTRLATGKYLALLDDDDVWTPRKLEMQVARLTQEAVPAEVVCFSQFRLVDEQGRGDFVAPKRMKREDEAIADYLFVRRWIRWGEAVVHPSTLICERSLAAATPWLSEPALHEDWDWLLRVASERNLKVIIIELPLVDVTQTAGSASRSTRWRESLAWVSSSQFLTNRQRADLLLCTTAAYARAAGDRRAVARIARHAFVEGRPGVPACLFFVAFQLLPPRLLSRLAHALPFSALSGRP